MLEGEMRLIDKAGIAIVKHSIETNIYLTETAGEMEDEIKTVYYEYTVGIKDKEQCIKMLTDISEEIKNKNICCDEWRILMAQMCTVYYLILHKKGLYEK